MTQGVLPAPIASGMFEQCTHANPENIAFDIYRILAITPGNPVPNDVGEHLPGLLVAYRASLFLKNSDMVTEGKGPMIAQIRLQHAIRSSSEKWNSNQDLVLEYSKRQKELLSWIEQTLHIDLFPIDQEISRDDKNALYLVLRSGIILRELMVTLAPATANKTPIARSYSKLLAPWMERENISIFLSDCRALGMAEISLFCTDDLYEGTNMVQVLFGLQYIQSFFNPLSSLSPKSSTLSSPRWDKSDCQYDLDDPTTAQPLPEEALDANEIREPTESLLPHNDDTTTDSSEQHEQHDSEATYIASEDEEPHQSQVTCPVLNLEEILPNIDTIEEEITIMPNPDMDIVETPRESRAGSRASCLSLIQDIPTSSDDSTEEPQTLTNDTDIRAASTTCLASPKLANFTVMTVKQEKPRPAPVCACCNVMVHFYILIMSSWKCIGGLFALCAIELSCAKPVVQWFAPFMSGGGYCSEAISFVEAIAHLPSRTYDLQITQHGDSYNYDFSMNLPPKTKQNLEEMWFNPFWSSVIPAIALCHSEPGAWHPPMYQTSTCPPVGSKYAIGRTMFETDRIPKGWAGRMEAMNEIWVPTKQQVFMEGGVPEEKIVVIPEAVDVDFFNPDTTEPLEIDGISSDTTVWEERKGWKILLRAYFSAFAGSNANVVLVLLTNAYHSSSDFEKMIAEFALDDQGRELNALPRIHIMQPHLPQNKLPSLYKAVSAFVLPSRGEGWGRPHVEAMSMGLPIIATYWSGTTEYMTNENSYPLNIDGLVAIEEGAFKGHLWANPSVKYLSELLVHVYNNPEEAKKKGAIARSDMIAKYSPHILAEMIDTHWQRILRSIPEEESHEENAIKVYFSMSFIDEEQYNKVAELHDGYRVSYAEVGDPNGIVVACFVGLHGHRHYAYLFQGLAKKYSIRLLCIDRPGYGLTQALAQSTTPEPKAFAIVIEQFFNELGIDRFGVMGQSAGALYALAIAAHCPDRLLSPVVLASPWVGIDNSNTPLLLRMASCCPNVIIGAGLGAVSASMDFSLSTIGSSYELPVYGTSQEESNSLLHSSSNVIRLGELRAKMTSEPNNAKEDVLLCLGRDSRGVGFEPEDIKLPVRIIHGEKDAMVPVSAVVEFVSTLPQATLQIIPGATHSQLGEEGLDALFSSYQFISETWFSTKPRIVERHKFSFFIMNSSGVLGEEYNRIVHLSGEKCVSYAEVGPSDGIPVLLFLGMHSHRHCAYLIHKLAIESSIHLYCIDRSGYGLTTPFPSTSSIPEPVEFADVIDEFTQALNLTKFGLMGQSAGAMYVMAYASQPERAAKVITPLMLLSPWVELENPSSSLLFRTVSYCPKLLISFGVSVMNVFISAFTTYWESNELLYVVESKKSQEELDAITFGELRAKALEEPHNALGDVLLCLGKDPRGDGVDPLNVQIPIHVVHGENDRMVPLDAVISFVQSDTKGVPVLCLLGMRGHRHFIYVFKELAMVYGIRLICVDRPGYGLTDLIRDTKAPTPISFVDIIQQVLEQLKIDRFGVMAQSAGAIYALAMATNSNLAKRIIAPLTLMSPWVGITNRACPRLLKMASYCPTRLIAAGMKIMNVSVDISHAYVDPNQLVRTLGYVHPEEDPDSGPEKEISPTPPRLRFGDFRARMDAEPHNSYHDALLCLGKDRNGVGFELKDVYIPVHVVHGEKDSLVPRKAAAEFVATLPEATLEIIPNATHALLIFQEDDSKAMLKKMELDYDSRMEEQVDDLREKMRLLQVDRKSNIEQLEANKNSNKELIRQLKHENKELRKQIADMKRAEQTTGPADMDDETTQIAHHLTKCRKQYDDVRHKVAAQVELLEQLKDNVKDLELESKKPSMEDTPETRKIRMLENRLDKAMIKYNEAQSIRKTYEQIVKRLKEERIGFDNQLAAIERAAAAKNHDYDELVMLSNDAAHAKELTMLELERVRSNYEEERRLRDKELKEKQQVVKMKLEMNARLDKREKMKHDLIAGEAAGLNDEESTVLRQSIAIGSLAHVRVSEEKKEHRSKIDIFESAFRKIKEATGVSDVNEVIQKIVSQEGTTENLMMLTKENQARLEALQAEHLHLKMHVEELKYSGSGGGHRRKMVDDHESNLNIATAKLERARLKYERVAKILISVKAGVEHLVDKIESIREDGKAIHVADNTIVEALHQSELTLTNILTLMQTAAGRQQKPKDEFHIDTTTAAIEDELNIGVARPYNQRIPLPGEGILPDDLEADDMAVDENDDALSRDRVKKASKQVLLDQDKKKKRIQKHAPFSEVDDGNETDPSAISYSKKNLTSTSPISKKKV
ncbi:hypothetical protein THRCLA_01532 [Thraustotheca clavata]|uniref:Calponin-homology (CH) domain-containing protein n=1 Tax=Thraustotheca clavata TaxID=74557 RepID=A0A1W0A875_9STRA|nr:hypothetical protein THRCLA_01532 [Thraustotheca clavata]